MRATPVQRQLSVEIVATHGGLGVQQLPAWLLRAA
jgi:hypothetical protein